MKPTSCQEKKFEEERVRRILLHFFPHKYSQAVLSESPDIIDKYNNVGVEVTDSHVSSFQQSLSRASNISGKTEDMFSTIDKDNIKKHRIVVTKIPNDRYLSGFACWGKIHDIGNIYKKKLKKLNSPHFQIYNENNLFICAFQIDADELLLGINSIIQINSQYQQSFQEIYRLFDIIYIFTEGVLIQIMINDNDVTKYTITTETMSKINNDAFSTIMGMSRDEYYRH